MTLTVDTHVRMRERLALNPDERAGQAAFNALAVVEPEIADLARGREFDPYYTDERLPEFWTWLAGWDS